MTSRRKRDKERTVQEVLTAAKHLFSEKGLHGTSIRDIENTSGVSKGLILHHFGNKENLYAAVQDLLTQEYTAMMASRRQNAEDLTEMIATAIRGAFLHAKGNREYRRISLWSYLEGQERTTDLEKRFTTSIIAAMRAGQEAGLVRQDIDAFIMPFIVRGTIDYWIQKEKLIKELSASNQGNDEGADERLIVDLTKLLMK